MTGLTSLVWDGETINHYKTVGNYRITCITVRYGDSSGATSESAPKWDIRQKKTGDMVEISHGKIDSDTKKVYSEAVCKALKYLERDGSAKYQMFTNGCEEQCLEQCLELEVNQKLNTTKITCAAAPDTRSAATVAVNIPSSDVGKFLLSDIATRLGCAQA